MRTYYLVNVLTLMFFITVPVQSQPNKSVDTTNGKEVITTPNKLTPEEKTKDSLLRLTNKELDEAIRKSTGIGKKQEELMASKETRRKAMAEYINVVNNYIEKSGRAEKVLIVKKKTDVFSQLKEGEIYLTKDSTCIKSKRPLFGKRKCVQWTYTFYLEDKQGKTEKL